MLGTGGQRAGPLRTGTGGGISVGDVPSAQAFGCSSETSVRTAAQLGSSQLGRCTGWGSGTFPAPFPVLPLGLCVSSDE